MDGSARLLRPLSADAEPRDAPFQASPFNQGSTRYLGDFWKEGTLSLRRIDDSSAICLGEFNVANQQRARCSFLARGLEAGPVNGRRVVPALFPHV